MGDFLDLISQAEIEELRNATRGGQVHPVVNLASTDSQVRVNTEIAVGWVQQKDESWARRLRPRLLASDDFTHASSALGELRAYGALLETGMEITPGPSIPGSNASPEFAVNAGDGNVVVEVHSRQLDTQQVSVIADHAASLEQEHAAAVDRTPGTDQSRPVVTSRVLKVFPTGAPNPQKVGDSEVTNTISRMARIKEDEKQVDPAKPFVLWLDLQDPGVWGFPLPEQFFRPLFTNPRGGVVISGAFWFALYGRKGCPLILSERSNYRSMPMGHAGRFGQTMKSHGGPTRLSAVVYSSPRATVLMENPNAGCFLPSRFRAALLKAPFFRLDISLIEWEPGLVAKMIEVQHRMIAAAEKALSRFDPLKP